jgi:hypothetical protein
MKEFSALLTLLSLICCLSKVTSFSAAVALACSLISTSMPAIIKESVKM